MSEAEMVPAEAYDEVREALRDLVAEFEAYAGQDAPMSGYYRIAKAIFQGRDERPHRGYELVRVAKEVLDELLSGEGEPVVLIGVNRLDDGTAEMVLRRHECPT